MTLSPNARLAYVNLFAKDIDALSTFYSRLFGFPEIVGHRSPIYRCLDAGGIEFGFNAYKAYDLLGLGSRKPQSEKAISAYFTFEVASIADIDSLASRAIELRGEVLKSPYDTYYNARQAVLADPEGNVFRINHRIGPRRPASEVERPPWD